MTGAAPTERKREPRTDVPRAAANHAVERGATFGLEPFNCNETLLSNSGRGEPGQGNVDWDDCFAGVSATDDRGPPVLESFAAINPDFAGVTVMPPKST